MTTVTPEYEFITNDSSRDSLKKLQQLKDVYAKHLPNMPREYILRLVFDKQHHSVIAFMDDDVVGGITFRMFPSQGFAEIAFCAVKAGRQVKGFGRSLMERLKEYCKKKRLFHLLTMADNNAIVFFRKQGFATNVCSDENCWKGYVKEYEGVTLMECILHPEVSYLNGCKPLLAEQKKAVKRKIELKKHDSQLQPGLPFWKDNAGKIVDFGAIPGLEDWWEYQKVVNAAVDKGKQQTARGEPKQKVARVQPTSSFNHPSSLVPSPPSIAFTDELLEDPSDSDGIEEDLSGNDITPSAVLVGEYPAIPQPPGTPGDTILHQSAKSHKDDMTSRYKDLFTALKAVIYSVQEHDKFEVLSHAKDEFSKIQEMLERSLMYITVDMFAADMRTKIFGACRSHTADPVKKQAIDEVELYMKKKIATYMQRYHIPLR